MTKLKSRALIALSLVLPACGQPLVGFSDAGRAQSTTPSDAGGNTEPTDTEPTNTEPTNTEPTDTEPTDTEPTVTQPLDAGFDSGDTEPPATASGLDAGNTEPSESSEAGLDSGSTEPTLEPSDPDLDGGNTGPTVNVPVDAGDGGDAALDASDAGDAGDAGELDAAIIDALPTVVLSDPAPGALDVSITKQLTVSFSEPMNSASLDLTSFTVRQGETLISGSVTYLPADTAVRFVPDADLELNTVYTATVSTDAEDSAGNPMAEDFTWSFVTSACALALVNLGSAGDFAALAGSTLTSTGPTFVTGDLGVSPGTEIVGFPPGTLDGSLYAGDPIAAQGVADLTTAYDDAAGRTLCAVTVSGNLGAQTLTPGLYMSTSSLEISSGDLTLDALGDEDAVFIFQMASTLTTTAGRQVILSGGAKASNVFWQVGTSATLGTTSAFQGTLMADQAITLNNGATLNGRALARIAAVSLDSNTIVRP